MFLFYSTYLANNHQEWGLSFSPERIEATKKQSGLKRLATVEDVASQVRALITSKSVTGQNVIVDAGLML